MYLVLVIFLDSMELTYTQSILLFPAIPVPVKDHTRLFAYCSRKGSTISISSKKGTQTLHELVSLEVRPFFLSMGWSMKLKSPSIMQLSVVYVKPFQYILGLDFDSSEDIQLLNLTSRSLCRL